MKRSLSVLLPGVLLAIFLAVSPALRADLIHRWEFEGDFADSVGDLDGAPFGLADITDDAMVGDEALQVNGAGDYVDVVDDQSLKFGPQDSFTLTVWAKPAPGTAGYRGVVTKGRDSPPWYGVWIDPNDRWLYGVEPSNTLVSTAVQYDQWAHVAIVQDGTAGTRSLYLDGVSQGAEAAQDANNFGDLVMGGALSVDEWFVGVLDDVRVYDEALSEEEIVLLASGGTVPPIRSVEADVSAEECPPAGRGPLTVTISQPVPDGADPSEVVTVTERLMGPVTASIVEPADGGNATDVFLDDAEEVGAFADHRNVVVNPACGADVDNGTTVEDLPDVYTQTSIGEDIWQNGDTFQFAYNVISGDFDVTVHVLEREPTLGGRWGKHGLMARQDLTPRSRYTYVHDAVGDADVGTGAPANNDDSTRVAARLTHGGNDNVEVTPYPSNPSGDGVDDYCDGIGPDDGACTVVHDDYLRLQRTGSVFVGYSRADPADEWTELGRYNWGPNAPGEVLVGLATTSHTTDCAAAPVTITYDEMDYADATIVPLDSHPVAVEITWSVAREALAAGVSYTVDLPQGDLGISGTVNDEAIRGNESVSLMCDSRIVNLTCTGNDAGGVDLVWENHPFADQSVGIAVMVNDHQAGTAPGNADHMTIVAGALQDGFNQICLINDSGLPACCGFFSGTPTLIHHWEFEGDYDDSVDDGHGTAFGSAELTDDAMIGETALKLNGFGDHVEVPDQDSLKFGPEDSFTLAAWVKPAFTFGATWRGVVTKGRDAPPWYGLWINPGNQWEYGASDGGVVGPQVTFDEWTHVTLVQNGPVGTRALYVDGVLAGALAAQDNVNTGNLWIGGAASVEEWLTGVIDDLRIYDVPLDDAHIEALASGELPPEKPLFHRGDATSDGTTNITDGIYVLNYLFLGGPAPLCLEAANADDSAELNITDGIYILNFLFLGGPAPPAPGPDAEPCGPDPDGSPTDLGCESYDAANC